MDKMREHVVALVKQCRKIGFPVVSEGMKQVIDDMHEALSNVEDTLQSLQDARPMAYIEVGPGFIDLGSDLDDSELEKLPPGKFELFLSPQSETGADSTVIDYGAVPAIGSGAEPMDMREAFEADTAEWSSNYNKRDADGSYSDKSVDCAWKTWQRTWQACLSHIGDGSKAEPTANWPQWMKDYQITKNSPAPTAQDSKVHDPVGYLYRFGDYDELRFMPDDDDAETAERIEPLIFSDDAPSIAEKPSAQVLEGWKLIPAKPTTAALYALAAVDGYARGDRDMPGLARWEDYYRAVYDASSIAGDE